MKKILILGGTGFIGKKIYQQLKKKYSIKNLSLSNGNDLRKENTLKKHLKNHNYDLIINCAAYIGGLHFIQKRKADILSNNSKIYLNLYSSLIQLKNRPKIINLISNCVYPGHHKIQEESKIFDGPIHSSVEALGLTKMLLLKLSYYYSYQFNISSLNLVLPGVYGPGDYIDTERSHALNGIIVRMIKLKESKKYEFEIWGSGKPKREWIFIDDVAKAVNFYVNNNKFIKNHKILNVGQNKSYSINYIAKEVRKILKFKGKLINNKVYQDGAIKKQLDNKNFKKIVKRFKFKNFKVGLKKTINYYKKIL